MQNTHLKQIALENKVIRCRVVDRLCIDCGEPLILGSAGYCNRLMCGLIFEHPKVNLELDKREDNQ